MLESCTTPMEVMGELVNIVRPRVLKQLQDARDKGLIRKSLEARLTLPATDEDLCKLAGAHIGLAQLQELFGVSEVEFLLSPESMDNARAIASFVLEPRPWDDIDDGSHSDDGKGR
jgi:hypothetical protein